MKFWLYCLLTQGIVLLGWLRDKLVEHAWMQKRYDRTFYASTQERSACCDCGLEHVFYPLHGEDGRDPAFRMVPIRLKGYDYRLRVGAGQSSPTKDESNLDPWTGQQKT